MIKKVICYGSKAYEIKDLILSHLAQIKNNIQSFTPNHVFTDLTLELCDPSSPDCPSDIKKVAGYTFPPYVGASPYYTPKIQINTNISQYHDNPVKYYSNIISHEFGHLCIYLDF